MKRTQIILLLFIFIGSVVFSQNSCNKNSDGIAIEGYDVVSYFDNKAKKGKPKYSYIYKEIKYNFSTINNLEKFKKNPEKYLPQYGGWCAYAMGTKAKKVDMDPKNFEIRDGKLYLFYKSFFINTHANWLKENPEELKNKADENWKKHTNKN